MDKRSTIGFVLIGLVLIGWMWLQAPPPQHTVPKGDTTHTAAPVPRDTIKTEEPKRVSPVAQDGQHDGTGRFFAGRETGEERVMTIVTDLYTAELSSRGGLLRTWTLHNFKSWDGVPVQLVDVDRGGDLSLLFTSRDGKLINTRNLMFDVSGLRGRSVTVQGGDSVTVTFTLPVSTGGRLVKHLTFVNGSYEFSADFEFQKMDSVLSNFEYQVVWEHGLRYAEHNSVDESGFAMAYASSGGEVTEVDASKVGENKQQDITGVTDWIATRNKYFLAAIFPRSPRSEGAFLEGTATALPDHGIKENYALALKMPFRGGALERAEIDVYLGPLEYDQVKHYGRGLEKTMNLGAAWIIQPISEYVMIPLLKFLRMFIPNYGVVIIVFSLIIKLALHPLTRTSMRSMRKMQALNPMMTEIRAKYKDDPQKMNAQVMNLYKEYGVNPASGCLPLLLQMPILFALYAVFRSSIELRQAHFVAWITDLSVPDAMARLPFTIPFFGITNVSGLALAMAVTMFVQQKMTVTDPRQKAMVWMMPIMMMLIFNSLPAGLNLYYFVFNLLSIGQQMWFNRQHKDEPLRKIDPKKGGGGILARLTKNLPKMK